MESLNNCQINDTTFKLDIFNIYFMTEQQSAADFLE